MGLGNARKSAPICVLGWPGVKFANVQFVGFTCVCGSLLLDAVLVCWDTTSRKEMES